MNYVLVDTAHKIYTPILDEDNDKATQELQGIVMDPEEEKEAFCGMTQSTQDVPELTEEEKKKYYFELVPAWHYFRYHFEREDCDLVDDGEIENRTTIITTERPSTYYHHIVDLNNHIEKESVRVRQKKNEEYYVSKTIDEDLTVITENYYDECYEKFRWIRTKYWVEDVVEPEHYVKREYGKDDDLPF